MQASVRRAAVNLVKGRSRGKQVVAGPDAFSSPTRAPQRVILSEMAASFFNASRSSGRAFPEGLLAGPGKSHAIFVSGTLLAVRVSRRRSLQTKGPPEKEVVQGQNF